MTIVGTLACAAGAAASGHPSAAEGGHQGRPTCTLEAGVLEIDPGFWVVQVRRKVDDITVRYYRGRVSCEGGPATVHTVDLIRLADADIALDMRGGAFEPGLTDEGDGSSEIEFEVDYGFGGELDITLGPGDQRVAAGDLGGGDRGLNLNSAETTPDVDLTIAPPEGGFGDVELTLNGGRGTDQLDAAGGAGFVDPFFGGIAIHGGNGPDLLGGGSGRDALKGGDGGDEVAGGAGGDFLLLKDKARDVGDCGKGRNDYAYADRRDETHSCKTFFH